MFKAEHVYVGGWENAIRGARNPFDSWHKQDSDFSKAVPVIGKNDHDMLMNLVVSGPEHCKFLRQIFVSADITLPLSVWKQVDQYKVGTVTDSQSTMHTIMKKPISIAMFSTDGMSDSGRQWLKNLVEELEEIRKDYHEATSPKAKLEYWHDLINCLPESFNQMRTWSANYAVLRAMYHQRAGHHMTEWEDFRQWCESLPYPEFITAVKQ